MTVGLIIAGIALALFLRNLRFAGQKEKQLKRSGGGN